MQLKKLSDFIKGWIVGDFEPSLIKTKDFEVAVKEYQTGDKEQAHLHKVAEEITVIVSGKFKMNEQILIKGDIIHLEPGESADFECLATGATTVIKMPSVQGDKYII